MELFDASMPIKCLPCWLPSMRTAEERVTVRHPVASTSLSMYPPQVPVISPTMFGSLPNIEGFFGRLVGIGGVDPGTFAGAFRLNGAKNLEPGAINGATNARNADFDASRCSAEYVTEASLQPSALQHWFALNFDATENLESFNLKRSFVYIFSRAKRCVKRNYGRTITAT